LYRLITDPNLITQYYNGVGARKSSLISNVLDGVYAGTLENNIKEIYKFIVNNYQDGDEILLFGFSRGAYTIRCVVGMIYNSGLVPDEKWTDEAYRRYRSRDDKDNPDSDESLQFKKMLGCREVKIKFLGLWDTVGAAGIPMLTQDGLEYMEFHDKVVSNIVQNVSHALAIHEHMSCFEPCHVLQNRSTKITELWFPGEHLDVGGARIFGYRDISDITLKWMINQMNNCTDIPIYVYNSEGSLIDPIIKLVHPVFDYILHRISMGAPVVRDRRITEYDIDAIYNAGEWGDLTVDELKKRFDSQTYNEYGKYMLSVKGVELAGFGKLI
jgi:uncharacterized protein (DUF2235 family)